MTSLQATYAEGVTVFYKIHLLFTPLKLLDWHLLVPQRLFANA